MISNELLEEVINISKKGRYISKGLLLRIAINVIENLDYKTKSKFQEFNEEYWQVIPIEKIAEADSYRNILSSLDVYPNFKKEFKDTYLLILRDYLRALKCGYHKDYHGNELVYNIPLIDYLTALNYKIKLEDLGLCLKTNSNISSKLSIEDRMKFGLPIKEVDVKELHKQKIILKSTK